MSVADLHQVRASLHAYRDFEDCIVRDICWLAPGFKMAVDVEYIWNPNDSIRSDDDGARIVTLDFEAVQEFRIRNAFNEAQLSTPRQIDWGHCEISVVEVEHSQKYPMLEGRLKCLKTVFWKERDRFLEIWSGAVIINES